jgi:hypothetical protein
LGNYLAGDHGGWYSSPAALKYDLQGSPLGAAEGTNAFKAFRKCAVYDRTKFTARLRAGLNLWDAELTRCEHKHELTNLFWIVFMTK